MEILPGLHQIEVPIPNSIMGPTNAYLARGTSGWLLVDTGWDYAEARDALERQLAEKGIDFSDIDKIVITSNPDYVPSGYGPPVSPREYR